MGQLDDHSDDRVKRRGSPAPLTAAVLAAIVERPSHGYEITTRINRRMGTDWALRSVYDALARLQKDKLLSSEEQKTRGERSSWKRVYYATELGEQTRAAWSHEGQVLPKRRVDRAWIVFSSPDEADQILAKLDEWEQDCMECLETTKGITCTVIQPTSWSSRMLNVSRNSDREQLEGEIRWIKRTRREIEEYLAESR
jgi:DNA-binding PadR family transcriptional regulator